MTLPIIILDPGHGLGNRRAGVYDPGAEGFGDTEAAIVMEWANRLRAILRAKGFPVVRTRVDRSDPCPVSKRAQIARDYRGSIMLSLHCNAADGKAQGTETFYRGPENKPFAEQLTASVCQALGTKNRGAKTEKDSQHPTLAVMSFQPCFLIELGFIDNIQDHERIAEDSDKIQSACQAIADLLANRFQATRP